jgi:Uma2 family endonuclease
MIPTTIGARKSTHVATAQPAARLTYEDYCAAPADNRYELLDGELIMVPAPNLKHQTVSAEIYAHLRQFIKAQALGTLLYAPCDVIFSDNNVVQPDLLFVSREREHLLRDGQKVQGPPDLVVEILSPSTAERDRGAKLALYSKYGVTEYWLVDPIAETVQVHRLQGGILVPTRTFGREETLCSALLVGLELRLDDIFSS